MIRASDRRQGRWELADNRVRVTDFINSRPISSLQYRAFLLAGASVFLDGYDSQAVAYLVPMLAKSWGLPPGAFGRVFAAGLIGSALGSLVLAPLADRFGRKRVMVAGAVGLGVFTLGCAAVSSITALVLLRVLAGLGMGAALPNALALVAEYAPERKRATAITATSAALALGAALGAVATTLLVPRFGWPMVFVAGGVGTLLLAAGLLGFLPESLPYLLMREPQRKQTLRILQTLVGTSEAPPVELLPEPHASAGRVTAILFGGDRAVITVTYGLLAFLTLLTLYLLNNWLPTLIHSMGFSIRQAAWSTGGFQLGGILGVVVLGFLADRRNPLRVVVAAYLAAAVCIAAIGLANHPIGVSLSAFAAGFMIVGAQGCNNAMLAGLYPTAARATALGWNLTVGRIGSILGPTVTGVLLLMQVTPRSVLLVAAIPAMVAAALVGTARQAIARVTNARRTNE
jgi:AAHS family 4-hydroxybenzoate transporter-like MFS transporter